MSTHSRMPSLFFFLATVLAGAPARAQPTPAEQLAEATRALSSAPDDVHWLKQAGIAASREAKLGVPGAARQAVGYLEHANERAPRDAEILAYLGSANALMGREGTSVFEKLRRTNRGLEQLDQAVRLAPASGLVRMIRASVSYEVPAVFRRRGTALEDYRFLVGSGVLGEFPVDSQAEILYKLGSLLNAHDERAAAEPYFAQAARVAPGSPWAARAVAEGRP